MKLNEMSTAPTSGVIQLVVEGADGCRRTYAAEASWPGNGEPEWQVTVGWIGWSKLHHGWKPIGWLPLTSVGNVPTDAQILEAVYKEDTDQIFSRREEDTVQVVRAFLKNWQVPK